MSSRRTRARKTRRAAYGSRPVVYVVASLLALLAQILGPVTLARAAPSNPIEAAYELRAAFGPAVAVCAHLDDSGAPTAPHCADDGACPLCAAAHDATAFLPPEPAALPGRALVAARPIRPTQLSAAPPSERASPAQPRAPPLEA